MPHRDRFIRPPTAPKRQRIGKAATNSGATGSMSKRFRDTGRKKPEESHLSSGQTVQIDAQNL
jgi:hypothetical protein